jgi:hypothetical protein
MGVPAPNFPGVVEPGIENKVVPQDTIDRLKYQPAPRSSLDWDAIFASADSSPGPVTNLVATVTFTTGATPTQNAAGDGTSGGPSENASTLFATPDATSSIAAGWNVNTAGGNQAVADYMVTDGLRPGNGNLGLNIDGASGLGLQPPSGGGSGVDPYSLYGVQINTGSGFLHDLTPADPLVLDLNGDGVRLTNYTDAPVLFDADNDGGSLEQTGWVSAEDGIVVHDLDGDGKINSIRETLSEYYNGVAGSNGVAGTKPFANGFAALKSLDSNNDNQFTAADAAWTSVGVWVDANHDGKTDPGELKSFTELGISSINLAAVRQRGAGPG